MDDLDILTLAEAGALLGRSPTTLRNQVAAGRLQARLIGKTWITTRAELERYRRESLGQPGRPRNILEPTKGPFDDVLQPGVPNVFDDQRKR